MHEDPAQLRDPTEETHPTDHPRRHPRVLIVSPTVLNTVKGGGVTLGRLFRGWPPDAIAQVHADILPPDLAVCRTYYSVAGPFYRRPVRPTLRRLLYLVAWVTRTGEHGLLSARLSSRLRRWLAAFRPEVVFSQTGSPAFVRLTELIVTLTRARLVLHASDDWVSDWPASTLGRRIPLVGKALASRVERDWRALARRADVRMAISPQMAEAYRERYGGDWLAFGNAIDLREWIAAAPDSHREDAVPPGGSGVLPGGSERPFRIMYSGSVIPASQLEGLRDLARVVAGLNAAGHRIELTISTSDRVPAGPELTPANVRIVPPAPQRDLPLRLASADVLYLPSVFSEPARSFYELSIPGKVAEYLASGRPILVYAPGTSALARSVERDAWAELVDRRDDASLGAAVLRLIDDAARRAELVQRARSVLRRDYDLEAVRPAFQAAIMRSAADRTR